MLEENNRTEEALINHEKALAIRIEVLGKEDDSVGNSLNSIANVLNAQGLQYQALEKYEQALTIWRKTLGNEHLSIAAGLHNIANILDDQDRYPEALEKYQQALDIQVKVLGQKDLRVADTLKAIGLVLEHAGFYQRALEQYQGALATAIVATDTFDHHKVAEHFSNLGHFFEHQGFYEEALKNYEWTLSIERKVFGDENIHVAISLNFIAKVLDMQRLYEKAVSNYKKALLILCNLFKSGHPIECLTYHLDYSLENLCNALNKIQNQSKVAAIPLTQTWGGVEVASADGLRFSTPLKTLNSGYNPKYFGLKKRITYYNYTSDQFTGFHGIVIPGTIKDSIYILEGLLEQQSSLQPTELMADTAGVSNLIFGLFWLLGYQFSPRLADICETTLCRIDPNANYGVFNQLPYKKINMHRIKENLDDMLRIAGSLKMGTVSASELIKSLLRSDRPSSLTKAIGELGKIPKTIYMLNYIDDETYRRRILNQINRGEGRHSLARFICHGQRGEIRKRYREGQEDQLSALGLVTNAVVLWNTMYIQKALNQLKEDGFVIHEEDVARLSPLQYKHINVLGHYSFTLNEEAIRGELRELNHADYEANNR